MNSQGAALQGSGKSLLLPLCTTGASSPAPLPHPTPASTHPCHSVSLAMHVGRQHQSSYRSQNRGGGLCRPWKGALGHLTMEYWGLELGAHALGLGEHPLSLVNPTQGRDPGCPGRRWYWGISRFPFLVPLSPVPCLVLPEPGLPNSGPRNSPRLT